MSLDYKLNRYLFNILKVFTSPFMSTFSTESSNSLTFISNPWIFSSNNFLTIGV